MLKKFAHKRGEIPIEVLAMLVVGLAVLVIVLLFFKGGLGEIGKKFGMTSVGVTGQTKGVTANMSEAVETAVVYPDLSPCLNEGPMGCTNRGGACVTEALCTGGGGTFFWDMPPLSGCNHAMNYGCCCR